MRKTSENATRYVHAKQPKMPFAEMYLRKIKFATHNDKNTSTHKNARKCHKQNQQKLQFPKIRSKLTENVTRKNDNVHAKFNQP